MKKSVITLIIIASTATFSLFAQDESMSRQEIIDGLREVTVAAVCDSVDKLTGRRGFMDHELRPLSGEHAQIVGPAITVLVIPQVGDETSAGFKTALQAIDEAEDGSVLVVQVKDDPNITGIGGLMAVTCKARDMEGAVIDGAARDVDEINKLRFPVFSRSICPSSVVDRYQAVSKNEPVECGGVMVRPGDIIVAGTDGVVVVPADKAAAVLKMSREIDEKEKKMVPLIEKHKSILKAVDVYNRI